MNLEEFVKGGQAAQKAVDETICNQNIIDLAKRAVAFERAFAVYFPGPAKEMAELASRVLLGQGVKHWISPDGRSITCTACRLTSYNPHDVAEHYCGACHRFLDDPENIEAAG